MADGTLKAGIIGAFGAGLALAWPAAPAWSAAFALQEQSASRLGTAFAGAGSIANDASTLFYNVGGLGFLERPEVLVVASVIDISVDFEDDGSASAYLQPLGVEGGDAGGAHLIPSLYAALPLNESLVLGLGVNAPFGLVTDWDDDWIGRFQARRSAIETINVQPSIAWRPNKQWSIGVGIDYQRIDAKLSSSVNYSAAIAQVVQERLAANQLTALQAATIIGNNQGLEGRTRLKGDDTAWGFNVGVVFEPVEGTRIGLSYRSKLEYDIEGDALFDAPSITDSTGAAIVAAASSPGQLLSNQDVSVDISLPELAIASVTHRLSPAITLMADVSWQRWSRIQELRVVNDAGTTISLTPEEWDDTWRFNVGGEWQLNERWTVRGGVAFDQSAVPDSTRTPRVPDSDRYWVALGAQWRPTEAVSVDFGYAHLFAKDGPSDQTGHTATEIAQSGGINGEYHASINVFAAQLAYRF